MKLYSQTLEFTAIKSICDAPTDEVRALLLGAFDESYFHYEPCKAAYNRLHNVAKKRSVILGWTELTEDPALNEEYRDILRDSEARVCKTEAKAKRLISNLDTYRKTRALYYLSKNTLEELKKPEIDVEKLLNSVVSEITKARSGHDLHDLVKILGRDQNALDLVSEALSVEDEILLKTGFNEIDDRNGGIPSEGVMLMAATTSGGKSTVLMNLLMNIYKLNKVSVSNVSLEMNDKKLTRRTLSRLTQIPYWKYTKKALTKEERIESKRAWRRLHDFGEKNDCQFAMFCPTFGVTSTKLFTLMKPYGFKVIGIDYAGLLEGVSEEDQWRTLSNVVREAKIFSSENKCLVIILAQLDTEDGRIRYSRGMLEHVDLCWTWNYFKPEVRETKRLPVNQLKARDQELYPFELKESFETMTVDNLEDSKPSSNGSKSKKEEDLNLDDEAPVDYDAGQK